MKKIAMVIAAAAMAVSANAQKTTITAHEAFDNIYIGVNAGADTKAKGDDSFSKFNPTFGLRVGKNFTSVFGLVFDAQAYFNTKSNSVLVKSFDVDLLGSANLMNAFSGYKGEPRCFEISLLGGFGYTHANGANVRNGIDSRIGANFALNLGKAKAWQVYIEPTMTWQLANYGRGNQYYDEIRMKYNVNNAYIGLRAGVNYKFKTSNGTHNFAIEQVRDQKEIDDLNAKINALRNENAALKNRCESDMAAKDAEIAQLQKALSDCENKPAPVVETKVANLQPSVVFSVGSSKVENSQLANIELIANYMKANKDAKVKISGYASPEGSKELNQKLSEARANNVKSILVNKYKIAASRIEAEGLGATDKLFDQVEFNRVALFNDVTK